MPLTITEGLAEIKTIDKRLAAKRASVLAYITRQAGLRDPLDKDGGSAQFIERERQAIDDLEARKIAIRRGIQRANDETPITLGDETRSISEWLTWRKEVLPSNKLFLAQIRNGLSMVRTQAARSGVAVVAVNTDKEPEAKDYIVNVNERELAEEIEALEEVEGSLDGQLSLKNATIIIEGV